MDNYDLEALYLYSDGWSYRVGKIKKVNTRSISMEGGRKVLIQDWDTVHKLTDEEIKIFHREFIKRLSNSILSAKNVLATMKSLKSLLDANEFLCIDSTKLQEKIDLLTDILTKEIEPFTIGDKAFTFDDISERIIEVKEEV